MAEDTNARARPLATHAETGSQRAHAALCGVHEERASALRAFHEDLAPPQVRLAQAFVVGQVQRGGAAQVDPGTVRQAQLAAFADARALPGEERTVRQAAARQPAATRGAGQQGERLEQRSAPRTHACQRVQGGLHRQHRPLALQALDTLPGPTVSRVGLQPFAPGLALAIVRRFRAEAHVPGGGGLQHLDLQFHGQSLQSNRQRVMARTMWFSTVVIETPRRSPADL